MTATGTSDEITDQIVKKMLELIRRDAKAPEITKVAETLKKPSRMETLSAVFDYIRSRFPYKSDPPGIEHLTAPVHIINGDAPYMDCDELVTITCCLLKSMKIPCLVKVIAWRKPAYTHVVLEAQLTEQHWLVMDPTRFDGFGNQVRTVIKEKRYKV